jgi:hypothetical protein
MLGRMLRNLLRIYLERDSDAEALLTVDLLLVLTPQGADEIRTRGYLYERLGCPAAAANDFRRYLESRRSRRWGSRSGRACRGSSTTRRWSRTVGGAPRAGSAASRRRHQRLIMSAPTARLTRRRRPGSRRPRPTVLGVERCGVEV